MELNSHFSWDDLTRARVVLSVPHYGFARQEAGRVGSRLSMDAGANDPAPPVGALPIFESLVGPVINAPIVSSLSSLPAPEDAEDTMADGSGGRGSSSRTLTGSDAARARTPTPPPASLSVEADDREVTQRVRGSSFRTPSPHPPIHPTPPAVGRKRARVTQEGLPDEFKKDVYTVVEQHTQDLARASQLATEQVEACLKEKIEMDKAKIALLEGELTWLRAEKKKKCERMLVDKDTVLATAESWRQQLLERWRAPNTNST